MRMPEVTIQKNPKLWSILGENEGLCAPGFRQDDDEFLASITGQQIVRTKILVKHPNHRAQGIIPGLVPERIVVMLEVIRVQNRQRKGVLVAGCPRDLRV